MKYLVYLLLGLNIAYFAWYQTQPPRALPVSQVAPLPANVVPLVLLSERSLARPPESEPTVLPDDADLALNTSPDSVLPEPENEETVAVIEAPPVCRTIGPIEAYEEATGLQSQLTQQGLQAALREGEIQAPSSYQVYLPAMSSKQAREVVKTLKAAGMNDYFVGRRNRISLGIFSYKGKARVRQHDVRQLGYDAILDVRYKTRKVYWIDIEESDRTLEEVEGWQQVVERHPKIQAQQVSCE